MPAVLLWLLHHSTDACETLFGAECKVGAYFLLSDKSCACRLAHEPTQHSTDATNWTVLVSKGVDIDQQWWLAPIDCARCSHQLTSLELRTTASTAGGDLVNNVICQNPPSRVRATRKGSALVTWTCDEGYFAATPSISRRCSPSAPLGAQWGPLPLEPCQPCTLPTSGATGVTVVDLEGAGGRAAVCSANSTPTSDDPPVAVVCNPVTGVWLPRSPTMPLPKCVQAEDVCSPALMLPSGLHRQLIQFAEQQHDSQEGDAMAIEALGDASISSMTDAIIAAAEFSCGPGFFAAAGTQGAIWRCGSPVPQKPIPRCTPCVAPSSVPWGAEFHHDSFRPDTIIVSCTNGFYAAPALLRLGMHPLIHVCDSASGEWSNASVVMECLPAHYLGVSHLSSYFTAPGDTVVMYAAAFATLVLAALLHLSRRANAVSAVCCAS
jgi:hypothetical protein